MSESPLPISLRLTCLAWVWLLLSACVSSPKDIGGPGSQEFRPTETPVEHQLDARRTIAPELLRQDFAWVLKQLESVHPQPFVRITGESFEKQISLVKAGLSYAMTPAQFYQVLAPLLASLRDVHSYIEYPHLDPEQANRLGHKLFPLAVVVQANGLFVAADLSLSPKIPAGAELLSINGAPVDFLLERMRRLVPRETESGQRRKVQLDFSRLLTSLGYATDIYRAEYLWQGQRHLREMSGLLLASANTASGPPASYYGFSQLNDSTGLLWLNDFNENPEVFERFLAQKFGQMTNLGIDNLIIDVRYNQGGLTQNLRQLLAYLSPRPIRWADQGVIKVSEPLKQNHFDKTRQRRVQKYQWGLQWLPLEWTDSLQQQIWWAEPGETISVELAPVAPEQSPVPQNLWVLTNGFCYSACSFFVASVNYHQLARTLGEKAGSLADVQFAYPVRINLPHSGLKLILPTMQLGLKAANGQALIEPAQAINRTASDIARRTDPVLEQALQEAGY